jgi:uncharacterized protein YyaL (SSP411 family)
MPNRLAGSTSPYLRQHQDNPVDWLEWGDEAFAEAARRDVPVLLSVGYSACHWCHVMAHESFEDPETADEMNRLFVNVKVDREERPDVDAIYMEAVQAMTGRGGWPMTVWLTPDGRPFYAGTYFPKLDRHGMPAFRRVMAAVSEAWRDRREGVAGQADQVTAAIARPVPVADRLPGTATLESAYRMLERQHDPVHGGFGGAPKFPQQPVLEFLLRIHREPWAPRAGAMLRQTLLRMARGGIYDHLDGGFARYSVDAEWLVPHFEKMLYDNAQLARLYLRAWQELGVERFRTVAEETLDYLLRDLRHPDGGFFSAEDADAEGEEGKFSVWTLAELLETAGPEDGAVAAAYFGVTEAGNFEASANVLHEARSIAEVAEARGVPLEEAEAALSRARHRLRRRRSERVRPGLDDKVIACWNGLAIRAFAEAAAVLGRPDYLEAARSAARFALTRLRRADGRLLRSWARGEARIPGFLDDHASLAVGLFALYQATGEAAWYREAAALIRAIPHLFADPAGGFFATGDDAERLVHRPKDQMDNPLPSGNSLAAEALLLLSLYSGDAAPRGAAEGAVRAGGLLMERAPTAVGHLLSVAHAMAGEPLELAVVGPDAGRLAGVAWEAFRPHLALAVDRDGSGAREVPLLADRFRDGRTLAYLCSGFVCERPVETPAELRALLTGQ